MVHKTVAVKFSVCTDVLSTNIVGKSKVNGVTQSVNTIIKPSGIVATVTPIQITDSATDETLWQFITNIRSINKDERFVLNNTPFQATLSAELPQLRVRV